ncbi:hypothetical protein MHH81_01285 [Psychrobacillus sp. FSL H8-0484]|uniref:hypothetical protein n=1 Tax=Psychrobacillus sp. FSL H8-0484 TaxID=2921390 RepID=UPI0030F893A8
MWSGNIVEIFTIVLAWITVGIIANRLYKNKLMKPELWKMIVVILIGLFSFSFHFTVFGTFLKISILPLGVWVMYGFLNRNKEQWEKYQPFAWLGFFANYIILASTLIAIPINYLLYSEDELATYMSHVENASIITIHPSGQERSFSHENFQRQLNSMSQEMIYSDEWYNETYMYAEPNRRNERFPYMLVNTSPKWGSGLQTSIYVEGDGKGLLISTPKKNIYFRSEDSLLGEAK